MIPDDAVHDQTAVEFWPQASRTHPTSHASGDYVQTDFTESLVVSPRTRLAHGAAQPRVEAPIERLRRKTARQAEADATSIWNAAGLLGMGTHDEKAIRSLIAFMCWVRSARNGIDGRGVGTGINDRLKPHLAVGPSIAVVPRRSRVELARGTDADIGQLCKGECCMVHP
jgi:hypothetical protein